VSCSYLFLTAVVSSFSLVCSSAMSTPAQKPERVVGERVGNYQSGTSPEGMRRFWGDKGGWKLPKLSGGGGSQKAMMTI